MLGIPKYQKVDLDQTLLPHQLKLLRVIAAMSAARRMPLYIVGGFVRDLLLRRPGLDLDLVVEGDAIALALALAAKHGGKVTAHKRFGTAQWFLPESLLTACHTTLDLISARSETYPRPGALPVIKRGTLADDLRRRDFTINTLALRLDGKHFGELHDDLAGLDDLEKGLVRALHRSSYIDDPTRILRAIRYEQRYGFRIADEDLALIAAAKPLLGGLSGERLRHELDLLLAEVKSAAMLARLAELGILAEIHASLAWDASLRPVFEKLNQPEPDSWRGVPDLARVPRRVALGYLLWLSNLDAPAIESLAGCLDFTANLRDALLASSALRTELPALANAKPSVITARLEKVPLLVVCALSLESASRSNDESLPIRLSVLKSDDESVPIRLSASKSDDESVPIRLSASKSVDESVPIRLSASKSDDEAAPIRLSASKSVDESALIRLSVSKSVDEYLSRWRYIKPRTTGRTLIRLGIPPGPAYQAILNRLRTAWLDGKVKTIEGEKKLLDKLTKLV